MNKKVSLTVLGLVMAGVIAAHVSWVKKDNGYLWVVDGRDIDIQGQVKNSWVRWTRSCDQVTRLSEQDPVYQQAQDLIKAYSPPHSQSAQLASVWTTGAWTLAETEFKQLLPAVVVIHSTDTGSAIVPHAVWSGTTLPWLAAPHIRQYLGAQAPGIPADLLDCFEPQSASFR